MEINSFDLINNDLTLFIKELFNSSFVKIALSFIPIIFTIRLTFTLFKSINTNESKNPKNICKNITNVNTYDNVTSLNENNNSIIVIEQTNITNISADNRTITFNNYYDKETNHNEYTIENK